MHLYERIFEDLGRAVDEGDIGPGERLPSIREVAERYDCNKLTAQKAFELLARSGRIENRVGAGSFARAARAPDSGKADFSTARLSESFFPYDEAASVLASLLDRLIKGRAQQANLDKVIEMPGLEGGVLPIVREAEKLPGVGRKGALSPQRRNGGHGQNSRRSAAPLRTQLR